jgi:hypothetical protein
MLQVFPRRLLGRLPGHQIMEAGNQPTSLGAPFLNAVQKVFCSSIKCVLQAFVQNISSILDVCCKSFDLKIA